MITECWTQSSHIGMLFSLYIISCFLQKETLSCQKVLIKYYHLIAHHFAILYWKAMKYPPLCSMKPWQVYVFCVYICGRGFCTWAQSAHPFLTCSLNMWCTMYMYMYVNISVLNLVYPIKYMWLKRIYIMYNNCKVSCFRCGKSFNMWIWCTCTCKYM